MSIAAIWGPPQSGKTTLAIDLAHAFSQDGKSVCLISPEPFSELTARMNIRITRVKSLSQAYRALGNLRQTVYPNLCELIRQTPEVFLPYFQDIASIQQAKRTLYGSGSKTGQKYTQGLDKLIGKLEVTAK